MMKLFFYLKITCVTNLKLILILILKNRLGYANIQNHIILNFVIT